MDRRQTLDKAAAAVLGDRDVSYGKPEDNFGVIAEFWTSYLRRRGLLVGFDDVRPADVGNLLGLMKYGRLAGNLSHADSYVDIAGYAACSAECETADDSVALEGQGTD